MQALSASQCRWTRRIRGDRTPCRSGGRFAAFSPFDREFFASIHRAPPPAPPPTNSGSRFRATYGRSSLERQRHHSSTSELPLSAVQLGGRHPPRARHSSTNQAVDRNGGLGAVSAETVSANGRSSGAREEHVKRLEAFYDESDFLFVDETWEAVRPGAEHPGHKSLEEKWRLVLSKGRVQADSRVLVWGGSPAFVQQLCLTVSPASLVVAHLSLSVLAAVKEMDDCITCWHGDILDFPESYGPFDVVFLKSLFAAVYSPDQALQTMATFCVTGGRILVCYAGGKEDLRLRQKEKPELIPHLYPDSADLDNIEQLRLGLADLQNEPGFYLATLEVTEEPRPSPTESGLEKDTNARSTSKWTSSNQKFPLCAGGHIVQGFGRGSKQMGVPTANIDPSELPGNICGLPEGVYFGWARLVNANGLDAEVYKMVMNVGNRPTFEDGGQVTVEVHIRHSYNVDFYGEELKIIVLGFIRDEMKFNSLGDLVQRINTDIAIAEKILDEDESRQFASDPFFGKR